MRTISNIIPTIIVLLFPTAIFANSDCSLTDGINVKTSNRTLYICEHGNVLKKFKVSLGTQGVGKMKEGDEKTPLGEYALSFPRKSNRFGLFIPIQYPTKQQISAGYTGSNVGIHGPYHKYKWLGLWFGFLNTLSDWTQGCIAVGTNSEIAFIANWVETHPQTTILIT